MIVAGTVVVLVTAFACLLIGMADLVRARFVLANSAAVGLPPRMLPFLGFAKIAGASGLLLGIVASRALGLAAGTGLMLFFIGAVAAHVRAQVFHNIAVPGLFLVAAIASSAFLAAA